MVCTKSTCSYVPSIANDEFRKDYFECHLSKRYIISDKSSSTLFSIDCDVNDSFCKTHKSTIIWENIFNECPMEKIDKVLFNKTGNFIINTEKSYSFNLKENVIYCNTTYIRTSEGMYLEKIALPSKNVVEMRHIDSPNGYLNKKAATCNFLSFLIRSFKNGEGFFKIDDINGYELIFYARDGLIQIPNCETIKTIEIAKNIQECTNDLPVYFLLNDIKKFGYLTSQNVITNYSRKTECNSSRTFSFNNGYVATLSGKNIEYKNSIRTGRRKLVKYRGESFFLNLINFKEATLSESQIVLEDNLTVLPPFRSTIKKFSFLFSILASIIFILLILSVFLGLYYLNIMKIVIRKLEAIQTSV